MKKLKLTTQAIMLTVLTFSFQLSAFNSQAQVTPTPNSPGAGNCLEFDGMTNHVQTATNNLYDTNQEGAVEFWINANSFTNSPSVFSYQLPGSSINIFWFYITAAGNISLVYRTVGTFTETFTGNTILNLNEWYHIVWTADGTNRIRAYINGTLETLTYNGAGMGAQTEWFADITNINITNQGTIIGSRLDPVATGTFSGQIDEVRVWNVARTQTQIRDNMCHTINPASEPNLVGYWTFDDDPTISCGGTPVVPVTCDISSNGNNGTLQ